MGNVSPVEIGNGCDLGFSVIVTGVVGLSQSFSAFVAAAGLIGDDRDEEANPDNDEWNNFGEWAQGLIDPSDANANPLLVGRVRDVGGMDYLTLSYVRLAGGTENGDRYEQTSAVYTAIGALIPGVWDQVPVAAPPPADGPVPPASWHGVEPPESLQRYLGLTLVVQADAPCAGSTGLTPGVARRPCQSVRSGRRLAPCPAQRATRYCEMPRRNSR